MDNLNVEALKALMNENRKSEHEFVFISAIKSYKLISLAKAISNR